MTQTNDAVPLYKIPLSVLKEAPPEAPKGFAESFDRSFCISREQHSYFDEIARYGNIPDFREKAVSVPNVPGFSVAFGPPNPRLFAIYDDATGKVVGGMGSGTLLLLPEYRGMCLASEALIMAYAMDVVNAGTMRLSFMSKAGRANRASAHRKAVTRAIEAGIDVQTRCWLTIPN